MMEILKKFRAVVFGAIALFLYLFGYCQARNTALKEQLEGENNAVKIAKKVRANLYDDRIKRLHNKYKR